VLTSCGQTKTESRLKLTLLLNSTKNVQNWKKTR